MDGLEKNLGQLFLVGFDGLEVNRDHPIVKAIVGDKLGGVILFDKNIDGTRQNIKSPEQLYALTTELQYFADNSLIIAVDQEGGKVCRLKEIDGFPATNSAGMLGSENNKNQVRVEADRIARSLEECGINFNLAPVVDLNLNPTNPIIARFERSYGDDPCKVAEYASLFITAHHERGIACCLKHFPGHGSAKADSHQGFVDITDCWNEKELEPYEHLISQGLADAVMSAHVVHRGLDPEGFPATLSHSVISGMLKKKIGFDGIVVTDDLQMKAISDRWGFEKAVESAVLAGVDLIIVGNNLVREENIVKRGVRTIARLIENGRISESTVCSSLDRLMTLKQKIAGVMPWKKNQPII